ncbi:hypothetical protein GCM10009530_12130 [Microbispora corallina]|uniref:Uncharacterized protein n=1 Tax=Microbispora corallina TaxID=83302 RepID=A0ABQ4FTD5_9ACTN|nr:hypothetical protein Mco01_10900 [Microbispora corallina]
MDGRVVSAGLACPFAHELAALEESQLLHLLLTGAVEGPKGDERGLPRHCEDYGFIA